MPLPRIPRPATVLAFAALVISLTGSAIAAKKYLITSTKQIKPSVLAQLKGNTGPAGAKGDTGAAGATGAKGDTGATGAKGDTGAAGTNGTDGTSGGTTSSQTVAAEVTTMSNSEVELDGGPSVTVVVPAGGANIILGVNFDAKNANGANNSQVAIYEGNTRINGAGTAAPGTTYVRRHSTGGGLSLTADAGSHTYTMRYQTNGGTLASFQNRTLIVTVLG